MAIFLVVTLAAGFTDIVAAHASLISPLPRNAVDRFLPEYAGRERHLYIILNPKTQTPNPPNNKY